MTTIENDNGLGALTIRDAKDSVRLYFDPVRRLWSWIRIATRSGGQSRTVVTSLAEAQREQASEQTMQTLVDHSGRIKGKAKSEPAIEHAHRSDENLILACTTSPNKKNWQEFLERFHEIIITAVYRAARRRHHVTPEMLEELVHDVYLKLFDARRAILSKFVPRQPRTAIAFLRVVATELVNEYFSSVHSQGEVEEKEALSLDSLAAAQAAMRDDVLHGQIDKCLEVVASGPNLERDRQIFWYYYRHGMSAHEIAQIPTMELTPQGVEAVIHRLTKLVQELMGGRNGLPVARTRHAKPRH